jgi:hypothetical protein
MICTKSFIVYGGVFDIDKFKPTIGKFKNCISFNVKNINLKVFKTSEACKIVISGCKTIDDAKDVLKNITNDKCYIIPIMTNHTFKLDFKIINLSKLSEHIQNTTSYTALYDINSLSLKVIIPLTSIKDLDVHVVEVEKDDIICYEDFLKLHSKEIDSKNISLSIFYTGSVILKGLDDKYNLPIIEWIIRETEAHKSDFECKIDKASFKSFIDI